MKIKTLTIASLLVTLANQSHAHEAQQTQIRELQQSLNKVVLYLNNETEVNEARDHVDFFLTS
ncbi:MAG: hypothetical protein OXK72_01555 [Gammaproteobacteria bacterium]|nr:hypothetical protein [Gammaproteobacteria bacterium]